MREYHVRFRERFGVKFPLSTRPKWNCKYHVAFAPKYRRKEFYDAKRLEIGKILRELCEWKGVNIIEAIGVHRPYTYC